MAAEMISKFEFIFAFLYKTIQSSVIPSIISSSSSMCSHENKQPVYICTSDAHRSIPLHSGARWWILGLNVLFSGCFIHCSSTCQEAPLDECPARAPKGFWEEAYYKQTKKRSKCSYLNTFTRHLVLICLVAAFAQRRWTTICLECVVLF